MKTYPYQDGDRLIELVEKRDYNDLLNRLESEKSTRNHVIKRGVEMERELSEARAQLDRICKEATCDWKQDIDGNWDTSCKQCICFEYAPPYEQGYQFCHHCGATINFIRYKIEEEEL